MRLLVHAVVAIALTGALAVPTRLVAGDVETSLGQRLVLGVPTFEEPEALAGSPLPERIRRYLAGAQRSAGSGSRTPPRPFRLELVPGNPYQILAWLEDGSLDGALASPLTRQLLSERRLAFGATFDLVKVVAPDGRPGVLRDYAPVARAHRCGDEGPQPISDVAGEIDEALFWVLKSAVGQPGDPPPPAPCRLVLPSHLSAAGWAVLLVRGDALLKDELRGASLDQRRLYEAAFWHRLFAVVDYSLGDTSACTSVPPGTAPVEIELGADGQQAGTDGWQEVGLAYRGSPVEIDDALVVKSSVIDGLLPYENLDGDSRTTSETMFGAFFLSPSLRPVFADQLGWSETTGRRRFSFRVPEALRLVRRQQQEAGCEKLALVLPGGGVKAAYQSVFVDDLYGTGAETGGAARWLRNRRADPTACARPEGRALAVDYVVGNSGGALLGFFVSRLREDDGRRLSDLLWRLDGDLLDSRSVFSPVDQMRWFTAFAVLAVFVSVLMVASRWRRCRFDLAADERDRRDRGNRWLLSLELAGIVLAVPLLVKFVNGRTAIEHVPALEGLFFFGILCLALLADQCLVRVAAAAETRAGRLRGPVILIAAGLALSALPVVERLRAGPAQSWIERRFEFSGFWSGLILATAAGLWLLWGLVFLLARRSGKAWAEPLYAVARALFGCALGAAAVALFVSIDVYVGWGALLFCVGAVAALTGNLWLRKRLQRRYRFASVRDFATALALPLIVLGLTYLVIIPLVWRGEISWLELTPGIWYAVFVTSAAITAILIALAAWSASCDSERCRWIRRGLAFLTSRHPAGAKGLVRCVRLLLLFGAGLLVWNIVQAPGLYGNEHARSYVRAVAERFDAAQGVDEGIGFQTYFAVPANTLVAAQDRYFLFTPGSEDRIPVAVQRDRRWWVCRAPADRERVRMVVFASGSPFPIFPPHYVTMPCPKEGDGSPAPEPLVDGGYAHNVPIEAVSRLGARQALILHSDTVPADGLLGPPPEGLEERYGIERETRWSSLFVGQLVLNLPRLIPFLFEQAQSADRVSQSDLLVISVAPTEDADHGDWPKLFDFRRPVVQRMLDVAALDLGRRVARVDNWPAPTRRLIWNGRWLDLG